MKKVWVINQYASLPTTGIGGRHRHLSRELAERGYKVTLVAARWTHIEREEADTDAAPENEIFEGFRFLRIPVSKYKHAHDKKRILNWFSFAFRLIRLPKKLEEVPDVIIYSSPSLIGYLGAYRLAKKYQAKIIFEVRDIWPLSLVQVGKISERHPFIRFMGWLEGFAYKKSDKVISNLREAYRHMEAHGMESSKFLWVPNGASIPELEEKCPAPNDLVAAFKSQEFSVVYTGTVGFANSLETLVRTAELVKDRKEIHFNVVGLGQRMEEIRRMVKLRGLDNFHFWPPVKKSQVQSVLTLSDVCYIGLTKDPLFRYGVSPNKLFDYLFASRPIIYAIDSGNYKPVSEAGVGFEVEPENPNEVAAAIVQIYEMSEQERREMGGNGRNEVIVKYNYASLAKSLDKIIVELTG
ncbi:MAG: glycosyltransferase WbuB [Rickettsiales bacterium]|nr:glycosyltransferase WbuB [Rickettsiales bacterium]